MEITHTVYLSIGSNQGDRFYFLQRALKELAARAGKILSVSPIYETMPLGFESNDLFLNACLKLSTLKSPSELYKIINIIEELYGRVRTDLNQYTSRQLDIDIIFYNKQIINTENLQIPHPRFHERLFVLKPLNDLDKGLVDPRSKSSIEQLLMECADESDLNKIKLTLSI